MNGGNGGGTRPPPPPSPEQPSKSGNKDQLGTTNKADPTTGSLPPGDAKKKKSNTTRRGVKRNNPQDWKDTMKLWDSLGYQDLLSTANRNSIRNNRVPIVDDAWIQHHPEDAGLRGQIITIHHVQGLPLNAPLPYSRHLDAHRPRGFRYNPGGIGSQLPLYLDPTNPPPPTPPITLPLRPPPPQK
ncbi:hypothetical protein [Prosthecobacter sp.]|uniref:hypothetical protein n=1 Tax=Prosthecobacter sp. TaxID=1965333 RepID=UPI003784D8D2